MSSGTVRQRAPRISRRANKGAIEDLCERCNTFRPRAVFVPGGPAICRECRTARRPEEVGPLTPSGRTDTSLPFAGSSPPVAPADYVLSRGRYVGVRLSEAPLGYLRACVSERPSSVNPARTHILWSADLRMIRHYVDQLDEAARSEIHARFG